MLIINHLINILLTALLISETPLLAIFFVYKLISIRNWKFKKM